jgi:hypothetical protein
MHQRHSRRRVLPRATAAACLASVFRSHLRALGTGLLALQLGVAAIHSAPDTNAAQVVVRPPDTGEALVNRGMGWTLHFYSNYIENYGSKLEPSDTLDDWPGFSTVFLRVPWSFLEPAEGQFNWSLFDTPAQRWIAKGQQIALCVSSTESWWRDATPKWVQDAGAKGVEFEFGKGVRPGGPLWEPDYLDPIFLQKLENFLAAMAKRYDGNPSVGFITIGSFGMWGEGHTVFSSKLSEERTLECVKRHIDLYVKYFPHTQLCISDDVAGATKPGRDFPATDYALSKGVTLRDDSILVSQRHAWFHAEMAQKFWPKLPVILEHQHFGAIKDGKKWNGDTLLEAVEAYHASYMSIHWWPREELEHWREPISRINRRLGYRLQLREMCWPAEVPLGESFIVETAWANAGAAPCYAGGFWALTLKDSKSGIASVNVDEGFDMKDLAVGPPDNAGVQKLRSPFIISLAHVGPLGTHQPPTKPGIYDVFVSVGTRDGTPRISLPLAGHDDQRRYRLGQIRLTDRK